MRTFRAFMLAAILFWSGYAWGGNYVLEGDMDASVRFHLERRLTLNPDIQQIALSFVIPPVFSSPTGRQGIENYTLSFNPAPDREKRSEDPRGNTIVESTWINPPEVIDVNVQFTSRIDTELKSIETKAVFPVGRVPDDVAYYLGATRLVQKDHPRIAELAASLTQGAATQYEAVTKIMAYVVDHVRYVNPAQKYDALSTLEQLRGNCQNFSHLNAALMRSLGIPVRIVNGITLNKPFQIMRSQGEITIKPGQGRHSWIEVWFPDKGWVPFDPQQTAMFVPNRYIRMEVGIDNSESVNDGLIRWSRRQGTRGEPGLKEVIRADFTRDQFRFTARQEPSGVKNFLLTPPVWAKTKKSEVPASGTTADSGPDAAKKEAGDAGPQIASVGVPEPAKDAAERSRERPVSATEGAPSPDPAGGAKQDRRTLTTLFEDLWTDILSALGLQPAQPDQQTRVSHKSEAVSVSGSGDLQNAAFGNPVVFGNLEFPEDIDFAYAPSPVIEKQDGTFEKVRAFWVETAEYVTGQRNQYVQIFIVREPVRLDKIGLALHYFGGEGQLWVDLYGDDRGKPGKVIGTSRMIDSGDTPMRPGYRWLDFDFGADRLILSPGAYWIGLGFTGSPVVNWFYSYGKPVGPAEGTRYRGIYETQWSGALPYEFNYRVMGLKRSD